MLDCRFLVHCWVYPYLFPLQQLLPFGFRLFAISFAGALRAIALPMFVSSTLLLPSAFLYKQPLNLSPMVPNK